MEPRPGLEPGTCRLRNEWFFSIPFAFNSCQSRPYGVIRAVAAVQYATDHATDLSAALDRLRDRSAYNKISSMRTYSTREAAEQLDIPLVTLQGHVAKGTVPFPPLVKVGGVSVRLWNTADIARARK